MSLFDKINITIVGMFRRA